MRLDDRESMIRTIREEVALTRNLTGRGALDPRVMAALARVPREKFVPQVQRSQAFGNFPLPIGEGQTISQPFIVALMTDLLRPGPTFSVLEIGTGSGYQAAVLSLLARAVYSVETIPLLAREARDRLERLGYANVAVREGNGYHGWPEYAPFDGIMVTAAAPHIPPPLVEQLRLGGRLVIPVGQPYGHQELLLGVKSAEGELDLTKILGVAFVPLTGVG